MLPCYITAYIIFSSHCRASDVSIPKNDEQCSGAEDFCWPVALLLRTILSYTIGV